MGRPEGAPFGVPAVARLSPEELAAIAGLVRKAREQGIAVTGPGSFEPQLGATRQRRLSDVDAPGPGPVVCYRLPIGVPTSQGPP